VAKDETLNQLFDLMKWRPTTMNSQPGHLVFIKSKATKLRLNSALLPEQFPAVPNAKETTLVDPSVVADLVSMRIVHKTQKYI